MAAPQPIYKLNFPIETQLAYDFLHSNHTANKVKFIIAFSTDLKNANDNLRRYGYYRQFRKRALDNFGQYVNNPDMTGIPFSEMKDPWWREMPYQP